VLIVQVRKEQLNNDAKECIEWINRPGEENRHWKLFELATRYLEKNDFGLAHTKRVFDIAKKQLLSQTWLQELTYTAIIFHDAGGSTIKDQYEKGLR